MPNVSVPTAQEKALLLELGMMTKDYGVTRRYRDGFQLLCYATRDDISINRIPIDDTDSNDTRIPDEHEQQILRENGIDPDFFEVTYRAAHSIEVHRKDTEMYVTISKGDRPW